jgi:hypothetical protein
MIQSACINQLYNGTICATAYRKSRDYERKHSILIVDFKMSHIDGLTAKQSR